MKVVCGVALTDTVRAYWEQKTAPNIETVFADRATHAGIIAACHDAGVLVGPRGVDEVLAACPSVGLFQIPWAGVQNVVAAFKNYPHALLANSHGNAFATAQYAVSLLLCGINRLLDAHELMRRGGFGERMSIHYSRSLKGRTVGILGTGHIGQKAANLLGVFGARIVGCRKNAGEVLPGFDRIYDPGRLSDFFCACDAVIAALPSTPATRGIVAEKELDALGPDGYFVNVGRGDTVDEAALFTALKGGRIAGAAVDVWYDYRKSPDESGRTYPYTLPFHELPNIILSPHRGGPTSNNPEHWDDVIENVNRFAAGRRDLLNIVDPEKGY